MPGKMFDSSELICSFNQTMKFPHLQSFLFTLAFKILKLTKNYLVAASLYSCSSFYMASRLSFTFNAFLCTKICL